MLTCTFDRRNGIFYDSESESTSSLEVVEIITKAHKDDTSSLSSLDEKDSDLENNPKNHSHDSPGTGTSQRIKKEVSVEASDDSKSLPPLENEDDDEDEDLLVCNEPYCRKTFKTVLALNRHKTCHVPYGKRPFVCDAQDCGKRFTTQHTVNCDYFFFQKLA